jgi:Ankyrin repeats (3 copies)/Ankyrin repeats (many copies)/Ankyrin repeat
LRWITMAFRPLTLQELAAAIGIQPSSALITPEQAVRDQVALCGLFLKVQEQGVGLVHQSARDYLLRKEPDSGPDLDEFRIDPEKAHLELAKTCFNCIAHSGLRYKCDRPGSQESPLLKYAVLYWPEHARCCSALAAELFNPSEPFFRKNSDLRKNWWMACSEAQSFWLSSSTPPPLLHMACHLGIVPWVAAILRKKSWIPGFRRFVNKKDNVGQTALSMAALQGHEVVVRLLVDRGADIHAKDHGGWTALHLAAEGGHEAVVRLLVDGGADIHAKDHGGWTALHQAAWGGHEAVVRLLADGGVDIHAKDHDRWTALHLAASRGHEAVVRLLVNGGADIHAKGRNGETALHRAASRRHEAVVRLLKSAGAS